MEHYYNTESCFDGTNNICVYCGQTMKHTREVEDYEVTDYWFCTCDDAQKEHSILEQIANLRSQLPRPKYTVKLKPTLLSL